MSLIGYNRIDDFNGASGAAGSGSVNKASMFVGTTASIPNAEVKTVVGQALDGAVGTVDQSLSSGNPATAMLNVTDVNHLDNSVMNTNAGELQAGNNAGASVAQAATAETSLQNLDDAIGGFEDHLDKTQNTVADNVNQCAADQSIGKGAAAKSFGVGSQRTVASAAGALAGGAALGGVSAIYDLRRMASDNLSPDAERQLAAQIAQTLVQNDIESGGAPQFNHEFLQSQTPDELVQTFKDLMRPANMHEEHEQMMALRSVLEDIVHEHRHDADLNEVVVSADVDSSDVAADELDGHALDALAKDMPIGSGAVEYSAFPHAGLVAQNDSIFDLNFDNDAISAAINDAKKSPVSEYEITVPQQVAALGAAA